MIPTETVHVWEMKNDLLIDLIIVVNITLPVQLV